MAESSQKTILVVDDEEAIRKFVSNILSRQYQVLVAESGEAAVQRASEFSGKIHLLLSNVQMPGITGVELGSKLTLERPDMKVMLMSGFTSGLLVLNEGWHFMHKPFVPSQLVELVRGVLFEPEMEKVDLNEHPR